MIDEKPEKPHIWWSRYSHRLITDPDLSDYGTKRTSFTDWRAGLQSRGYVGWPQP